jgi:hypothetical protein
MNRELKKYHLRLSSGLDDLLVVLRGMSDEQRRFRAKPDAWSAIEVAHHVFLAERGAVAALEKHRGVPARRRTLKQRLGKAAVAAVFRFNIAVENPAKVITPDPEVGFDELEREWWAVRDQLLELLESMDASSLTDWGLNHPISGPLTVEETMAFLADHLERHLAQIRKLRSAESYPTAPARA